MLVVAEVGVMSTEAVGLPKGITLGLPLDVIVALEIIEWLLPRDRLAAKAVSEGFAEAETAGLGVALFVLHIVDPGTTLVEAGEEEKMAFDVVGNEEVEGEILWLNVRVKVKLPPEVIVRLIENVLSAEVV